MIIADLVARNGRQCPDQIAFVEVRPISKGRKDRPCASKSHRQGREAETPRGLCERKIDTVTIDPKGSS